MTEPTDPTVSTPADDAVSVLSSVAAGVGTITLNRPAVNNAYDGALLAGVVEAAARLAGDAAVRLLVIRANGRHFQAGADLKWLRAIAARDEAANLAASHQTAQAMRSLNEIGKPVLALVHGACIGGGTGLIASCDIVVAEATATFAISEARWGLTAAIIFPQLVAAIGIRQLRRYALTCETFDARRARELGLVHEVCEAGALDTTAAPRAAGRRSAAPEAVGRSKRFAMQCAQTLPSEATWRQLEAEHGSRRRSAEAAEGLDSFRARRDPAWVKNLERSSR